MDLTEQEREQLRSAFGGTGKEFAQSLAALSTAATEEYLRMALGQRVFTRGTDIREYRLFLLIKHVFGVLPSEQQVCALFQTTAAQSRGLLRAVMSKYQYDLRDVIDSTLAALVSSATRDSQNDMWHITVDSENVIAALNRRLAAISGTLPPLRRLPAMVTTFEMAPSARDALHKELLGG